MNNYPLFCVTRFPESWYMDHYPLFCVSCFAESWYMDHYPLFCVACFAETSYIFNILQSALMLQCLLLAIFVNGVQVSHFIRETGIYNFVHYGVKVCFCL